MSHCINIEEEIYKKFQAALLLTGEEENTVLCRLISQYAHQAFEHVMKKTEKEELTIKNQSNIMNTIDTDNQKQLFITWFRSLKRNGKAYNPVTISGYAGRLENACNDPIFASVPINNIFKITDINNFITIKNQIKNCKGYVEYDYKLHNGFTAALKKYEEFLKFQASGNSIPIQLQDFHSYSHSSNIHRWTIEEDEICCKMFLEYYVINKSTMSITQFLQILAKKVPNISEGSLRMKIQNIKYLTVQAGLKDTSTIKWLSQYSTQCEKSFIKIVKDLELSV